MTMTTQTDIQLVAHFMRRAAFGAPAWKLERLAEQPYEDLVESFVEVDVKSRPEEDLLERFNTQHADEEAGVWTGARLSLIHI